MKQHKLQRGIKDLGKEYVKILIQASVCEDGIKISVMPDTLDPQLVKRLADSVSNVILEWDKMIKATSHETN